MSELSTDAVSSGYLRTPVLRHITMSIGRGEFVGILGANGAGKSTLLRTLVGAVKVSQGTVTLDGTNITTRPSWWRARHGIGYVADGRQLFGAMTVEENLTVAGLHNPDAAAGIDRVYETFPKLGRRRRQWAGTMSGGEQQMLAIGRALMTRPRLLLVDELSAGLAPVVAAELVDSLATARGLEMSLLVVEQSPYLLAGLIDRCYVLRNGVIVAAGTLDELGGAGGISRHYLLDDELFGPDPAPTATVEGSHAVRSDLVGGRHEEPR